MVAEAESCSSAVQFQAGAFNYSLASACAHRIATHAHAVRKAGFPIPVNGANTKLVEGGTSFNEATYLGELARKASTNASGSVLCQTGFNYGTSAQAMLCASEPEVKLYSWDLGEHPYVRTADDLIQAQYRGRHILTLGDSTKTLRAAAAKGGPLPHDTRCDFVFVDGGHSAEVARSDIQNFRLLAKPGAMLVVDDCGEIGRPGADKDVSTAFIDAVSSGLVVPNSEDALRMHTDFHSQAHAICVGHYA